MKTYSRVCAKVDLDKILYNIKQLKAHIKEEASMMLVVKADGYGHGAVQTARVTEELPYVWGYATATLDEAVILKKAGIQKPVLVLGCTFPEQYEAALSYGIRMTVYTKESAAVISNMAAERGVQAHLHIKVDTGMSRLGFFADEEGIARISEVSQLPNLHLEGIFTHFAKADETDKSYTDLQISRFRHVVKALKEKGIEFTYHHCANSAGIIDVEESDMDLVRAGIAFYGLYPSDEVKKDAVDLKPALSLVSHIVHVKWIPAGTLVSYGGCYESKEPTKVATIPIGYADGYPRSLSDKGYVLIRGQKAPVIGRVCMDQCMVDVTHIPDAQFMDPVTLVGTDGGKTILVEDLSALSGRFNYEFLCNLDKRIPREYIQNGEVTAQLDYFA